MRKITTASLSLMATIFIGPAWADVGTVQVQQTQSDLSDQYVIVHPPANDAHGLFSIIGTSKELKFFTLGNGLSMTNNVINASGPSVGAPTSRSVSIATAYQATDTSKPAIVTVTVDSTATLTLTGGTTNAGEIRIGSTNAVATGGGMLLAPYSHALTGTVVVGVSMSIPKPQTYTFVLPAGWYFAVRQTAGTISITSAFDQALQ